MALFYLGQLYMNKGIEKTRYVLLSFTCVKFPTQPTQISSKTDRDAALMHTLPADEV